MSDNDEILETCDKCEGSGKLIIQVDGDIITYEYCSKCMGRGKLNWIQKIFGVQNSSFYFENDPPQLFFPRGGIGIRRISTFPPGSVPLKRKE